MMTSNLKIRSTMLLPEPKGSSLIRAATTNDTNHTPDIRLQSQSECSKGPHIAHQKFKRAEVILLLRAHGLPPKPSDKVFDRDDDRLRHEECELARVSARNRVSLPPVDTEADEEGEVQLEVTRDERPFLESKEPRNADAWLLQSLKGHRQSAEMANMKGYSNPIARSSGR